MIVIPTCSSVPWPPGDTWAAQATATVHALAVLDAAGFDDIVVETVGVGQSEVEIADATDTTAVVLAPGLGDAVQAAKAGILEVADIFVVNKADHPGVGKTVAELRGMLRRGPTGLAGPGFEVPITRTVAVRSEAVGALADALDAHGDWLTRSGDAADVP